MSDNSDGEIEVDQNGNIITLEDGREVIYIPATGLVYSYTSEPRKLGKLSPDLKNIVES